MARHTYMILSRCKPGQEEAYRSWYRDQHLPDVARHPHVVSARVFNVGFQKTYDLEVPQYVLMTLYELESDDPQATVEHIKSLSGSEGMPMTDAIDKSGMVQAIGRLIREIDPA